MPNLIPIKDLDEGLSARVGPKARNLARMLRLGFNVPAGICLTMETYRGHLTTHGLLGEIEALLERAPGAPATELDTLLAGIRGKIIAAPMDPELQEAIGEYHRRSRSKVFAVRSSAASEDLAGHSFAGQHDSYLGITEPHLLTRAIQGCWASLWSLRAFEYRNRHGFDHLQAGMGVILQELVPARAAGVVFTADPLSGDRERLTIESGLGLGDALVAGRASPDRLVLRRKDLRIMERTIAAKTLETVLAPEGGIASREVPDPRARQPAIDDRTARRLARAALRIEKALGSPQDLEWACSRNQIFILQSRPITALPAAGEAPGGAEKRAGAGPQVWTNSNVGEVLPDVASPLTWSLVDRYVELLFGSFLKRLGLRYRDLNLVGLVAGRGYFNLSSLNVLKNALPGARGMELDQVFGGLQGFSPEQLAQIRRYSSAGFKINPYGLILRFPGILYWFLAHPPTRGQAFVEEMKRNTDRCWPRDLTACSDAELLDLFRHALNDVFESAEGFAYAAGGLSHSFNLSLVCRKWLDDRDGSLAGCLLSSLGDMESAQSGLDLWSLAAWARAHPRVAELIRGGADYASLWPSLAEFPAGREFQARWESFMGLHGHHARGEIDVMNPRWCETPDYILDQVRGLLGGPEGVDPVADHQARAVRRRELTRECRHRLGNPLKRALFDYFLKQSQIGLRLRENVKSQAVRRIMLQRLTVLEMGRRLHRHRVLGDSEDIFFLNFEEIEAVLTGRTEFNLKETVARRRAEYARNLTLNPPRLVIGSYDSDTAVTEPVPPLGQSLKGLPVSPGTATGPARIILRSDTEERVQAGEILVAPFTDPGWTPYFISAAGIVMDQGGMLSHGSIVARELGIPAVVNVGPATRTIKTGQRIKVDGYRGVVEIVPEGH